MEISLKAYGKINIGLDVTGRRKDGYHLLNTVFQTIDIYDEICMRLEAEEDTRDEAAKNADYKPHPSEFEIYVKTDDDAVPSGEGNLAYKAARLFGERFFLRGRLYISIKKNIPMAAGLAGGSADAAAVLKGLQKLVKGRSISLTDINSLAVRLGADVPFCLRQGTWQAEGIGDELRKLNPIEEGWLTVVKPDFGISTEWSYRKLDEIRGIRHPDMKAVVSAIRDNDTFGAAKRMENILEIPAIMIHPEIAEIKRDLLRFGAEGASMSGSGAAVFGIFKKKNYAKRAAGYFTSANNIEKVFLTKFIH